MYLSALQKTKMYKALIIAAIAAYSAEAAPGRSRNQDKLKNDRAFQAYAAKYNKNIEDTAAYLAK